MDIYFSVSTRSRSSVTDCQIDFEGDGLADYRGPLIDNILHSFDGAGVFFPTITITDSQGNQYSDTLAVVVLTKAELDAVLKGKWDGMKREFMRGDKQRALSYIAKDSRPIYEEIFTLLADKLPSLASSMRDISMMEAKGDSAEYVITRPQRGVEMSYFIYFVKDDDGIWRINAFKKRLPKSLRVILIILCLVYGIGFLMIRPFYYGEQEPLSKFRGWIYFQDGPYKGKVVDAETGEPIEGALVAGFWYVDLYGLRISDPLTVFCDAQETMTDKDGAFSLPKGSCFNPWPMTVMGNPQSRLSSSQVMHHFRH
ncbi:MAG: carboxypeptidase-like regulatory domain-containing protein [Candidatus Moduliflexus flocculans]|nr:carboxypeptidase-like regulatory domain-containing protein [Candidatus Moduliflexus flocculans]